MQRLSTYASYYRTAELIVARTFLFLMILLLSACRADTIEDRRAGQVVICHDGKKTLTVSDGDSFSHLSHGDTAGPCPDNKP
jgi:hypothetical protein